MGKDWGGAALGLPAAFASLQRVGQAHAFAIAVVFGSLITLTRVPLQGALGAGAPFILVWPGAIAAALIGGFWPTIVVGVVGFFVGQWALVEGGGRALGPGGTIIFAAFVLVFAIAGSQNCSGD